MIPTLFQSNTVFQQTFVDGLSQLLQQHDELGVMILVMANATFDAAIWDKMQELLERKFQQLSKTIQHTDNHYPTDDLEVFQQLIKLGFKQLQTTQFRQQQQWEIQYNQLRSFRPPRNAHKRIEHIQKTFCPDDFHFNKPFLKKEIFWEGELSGRHSRLLYNKFPFVELHALLVPDPEQCLAQFLQQKDHQYLWKITQQLAQNLTGLGFGYNSYGAFSSVNHLHFQLFVRQQALPICHTTWQHNGGDICYPTRCQRFDDPQSAWQYITQLHAHNISYNLIYLANRLYVLARKKQGHYPSADWTGGFAWYELAGGFTTFNKTDFNQLTTDNINQALACLSETDIHS